MDAGRSRLLTLPAELRNLIFEFALTGKHGLRFDFDDGDTGRLYTFEPKPRISLVTFPRRPPIQHVRNKPLETNQLRYVCKQLYNETSGVILRLNDLNFHSDLIEKLDGNDKFQAFLRFRRERCLLFPFSTFATSSTWIPLPRTQLRRIVVHYQDPLYNLSASKFWAKKILTSELTEFCDNNPNCTVQLNLNFFDRNLPAFQWVEWGVILELCLQGHARKEIISAPDHFRRLLELYVRFKIHHDDYFRRMYKCSPVGDRLIRSAIGTMRVSCGDSTKVAQKSRV